MSITESELRTAIAGINQASLKDGKRAPHQPLFLLWLLGRLRQEGKSETDYEDVEAPVSALIDTYGPAATSKFRAELPFFHLSEKLWELDDKQGLEPKRRVLLDCKARGRLRHEVEALLLGRSGLIEEVARFIIEAQFTESYIAPIFASVGLDLDAAAAGHWGIAVDVNQKEKKRDPKFRKSVLVAWRFQCAMCGYDGQMGAMSVGLEAAHVKWFAHGGPDDLDNGLALCELHHALFDLGTIGLSPQLKIIVANDFIGKTEIAKRMVYDLHERSLLEPAPSRPFPLLDYVLWHGSQVFKSPVA